MLQNHLELPRKFCIPSPWRLDSGLPDIIRSQSASSCRNEKIESKSFFKDIYFLVPASSNILLSAIQFKIKVSTSYGPSHSDCAENSESVNKLNDTVWNFREGRPRGERLKTCINGFWISIEFQNMSEEITVRHIQKLDGINFLNWKFQLKAVFIAAGVSNIVNDSRTMSVEPSLPVIITWRRDNAKAMVLISTSVDMSQLESLITCEMAKEK